MLWENLREEEFKDAIKKSNGVCILPIGCLEKHGQHMPVGTDAIQAAEFARIAADKEYAVVFPTMYFGEKTGAGEFAGTVMFSAKLRFDILTETCREIARNGFKKILIYNCHGGNHSMIGDFTRSVLFEKNDYMVFNSTLYTDCIAQILEIGYDFLTDEDTKIMQDFVDQKIPHGHACFVETGFIYSVRPETIRLDKMNQEDGLSNGRFDDFGKYGIGTPFAWMANYPNSYSGGYFPGLNERIAKAIMEYQTDLLAERIKFLKTETISDEYHKEWLSKQK
ncbi:MAG: creatininase family protein [Clostridia bacterium]|nr:creatininase family protein [Clostridia bacterium]